MKATCIPETYTYLFFQFPVRLIPYVDGNYTEIQN